MTVQPRAQRFRRYYSLVITWASRLRSTRHTDYGVLFISMVLGIGVGLSIVVFHVAMHLAQHFFEEVFVFSDTYLHIGRFFFPIITAFGGLCVGILSTKVFSRAHGEGLHMLVEAIRHQSGKVHWISTFKAVVTAALSIGSGGGGGKEGPIILLGSSVGSTLGQLANLRPNVLRTLCASGAAAAISGIFNAPLAGLVFALEGIFGEFALGSFISVVVSSVLSTAVARTFLGNTPVINFPSGIEITLIDYVYIGIGGLTCGLISIYYLKLYQQVSLRFASLIKNISPLFRPMIGGLLTGILASALPTMLETTYAPINMVIAGKYTLMIVAATILAKPFSNAFTLSSGGSGGTFAPVLKVGAMWGFLFGTFSQGITPFLSPALYAVIGAGAVLSGTWRIPLTGAILICEASHNYDLLLPMLFACILAVFVAGRFTTVNSFNPIESKEESEFPVTQQAHAH